MTSFSATLRTRTPLPSYPTLMSSAVRPHLSSIPCSSSDTWASHRAWLVMYSLCSCSSTANLASLALVALSIPGRTWSRIAWDESATYSATPCTPFGFWRDEKSTLRTSSQVRTNSDITPMRALRDDGSRSDRDAPMAG